MQARLVIAGSGTGSTISFLPFDFEAEASRKMYWELAGVRGRAPHARTISHLRSLLQFVTEGNHREMGQSFRGK